MAGVRKNPNPGGKFHGWFIDAAGKRKFFTGTRSKANTLRMAERLEDEHRQVRLGYRPAPSSADKQRKRPIAEVMEEYLAWGKSQGGRGGRPWASVHAHNRKSALGWWQEALGLETLADLEGCLPRAEKALRELQAQGKAGKTLANRIEALRALCIWAEQRGYLSADPLKGLAPFDTTPKTRRRALSAEEISRFLSTCAPHLRLLYEAAFLSGLRAGELRALTLEHLDKERSGLILEAAWTKNRQPGFQPLPKALVERLSAFAEAGEPDRLYERAYTRSGGRQAQAPQGRLLYVPAHTEKVILEDLERAGIPHWTPQGKVDFHALRVAFVNLVFEAGEATGKEAQHLARHSTPNLTFNVYGRVREDRLHQSVEKMAEAILPPERAICVQKMAVGAEIESATPFDTRELRSVLSGSGGRARTYFSNFLRNNTFRTKSSESQARQCIAGFALSCLRTKPYTSRGAGFAFPHALRLYPGCTEIPPARRPGASGGSLGPATRGCEGRHPGNGERLEGRVDSGKRPVREPLSRRKQELDLLPAASFSLNFWREGVKTSLTPLLSSPLSSTSSLHAC